MEKSHQWPQFLAVCSATLLAVGNGIQLAWASPSIPKLLSGELGFNVSEDEVSYIVMLAPLAYLFGSPIMGYLLDTIGRKYTLLCLAPIQIIGWFCIIFSKNMNTLYCSRILMGISEIGLHTCLPAYIGEIMEPKVRGMAGTSTSLAMVVGSLLINIYGSFLSIRVAAHVSQLAPLLFLLTFIWMPESPYHLIAKGADQKAREALKWLRRMNDVETELSMIKKAVQRQLSEPGHFRNIFTVNSNLKAFTILAVLRTVQQFCGLFVVVSYMQTIFISAQSILSPHTSAIICCLGRICSTVICSICVDRFGRRGMLIFSSVGAGLALAAVATYHYVGYLGYNMGSLKWLPLTSLVLYYMFCSAGLLVVPSLMVGELLPVNIKAKALSLINIYFGLCMSASSKLFHWTDKNYGAHVPFYIFSAVCLCNVVFVYTFVPETKGKTLEEIQHILKETKAKKELKAFLEPREV